MRFHTGGSATSPAQNHPLTDDGRHVFFSTAEALVPQDINGKIDVYEYDAPSGTVHLITTGTERSDSYFMNASPSGDDALFLTRAQLVGADADNNYDLYDARVDGGFPEPPPTRAGVLGRCVPGPAGLSARTRRRLAAASSTGAGGAPHDEPKPKPKPKRCRKGYVRKKVRGKTKCVKKPKAHKRTRRQKAKRSRSQRRAK